MPAPLVLVAQAEGTRTALGAVPEAGAQGCKSRRVGMAAVMARALTALAASNEAGSESRVPADATRAVP